MPTPAVSLPDLGGKTYVITGANIGLGQQTALNLTRAGATVVMACRNQDKARAAEAAIRAEVPAARLEHVRIDLADYASVRAAAADVLARFDRIDALVNNAGLFFDAHKRNAAGHEMTLATNHLGGFLLTGLLLDRLKATPGARVVTVSSDAHRLGRVDFGDLHGDAGWGGWRAYGTSKLANIWFTRALARRLEGTGVTANCCHPGFVASNFGETNASLMDHMVRISKVFAITTEQGARTQTWLAASPDVAGQSGGYYYKCRIARPNRHARDDAGAERLWQLSQQMVGLD